MKQVRNILKVSIFKTLWINYVSFGFIGLVKLPILVGKNTHFRGIKRGVFNIEEPFSCWKKGYIRIGISQGETYPPKMLHSLVSVGDGCKVFFAGGGKTKFYAGVSVILRNAGVLRIGNDCIFNEKTLIVCHESISIGNYVNVGWNCQIYDTDQHLVYNAISHTIQRPFKSIVIGNNVWLSNHVTISKGANIPPCSIVAFGSLVNKDFSLNNAEGCLIAGVPATIKVNGGLYRIRNLEFERMGIEQFKNSSIEKLSFPPDFPYKNYLGEMK